MYYSRGIRLIMEKPILSPNFTIEDIHKLRYYLTKDMPPEERRNFYQRIISRVILTHRIRESIKNLQVKGCAL